MKEFPMYESMIVIRRETSYHPDDWTRLEYDDLYREKGIRLLDSFYEWVLDILNPQPGTLLLDVSCGEGVVVREATRRQVHSIGFDLSLVAAQLAARETGGAILVANGQEMPFPTAYFDYVTNVGSLEHFIDMAQGVREMARVLRPGGRAAILVPNTFSILQNSYEALRKGHAVDDGQPLQRYGARKDWERLLENNGLRVHWVGKYEREIPRSWEDVQAYLSNWRWMVRLALSPLIPVNWASHFYFICERAPDVHLPD